MHDWFDHIDPDERTFVQRFLLHSGSLKSVAAEYGVSYPTVRQRLDRLIAKIEMVERLRDQSPFERALRLRFAEGGIDESSFRHLLALYRQQHPPDGSGTRSAPD